ncbi:MAG: carboxypeptidase regulatory-like domain-containing protein, partial [Candidatus Aminicenantes bacterium]|nr:carboxypeptidase regulatory-like domain-containing protein [Candidatus Aminicenantes bacterium]
MKKQFIITAALIMFTALLFSQSKQAGIHGTIIQTGGSGIPGVTVTLTNENTGKTVTTTSARGNFRLLNLPPGTYQLTCEKAGFKTVIYKDIRIFTGQDKNLRVNMESGAADPAVVMSSDDGAIDVRAAEKNVHITNEMLQSLPTGRNPWSIINLVPGMLLDREDVGGSESGAQYPFYGLGANSNDTTWLVDGVNISGPQAIGSAPAYLNTNTFEEIQVTLAANDITSYTGGTRLNFVSKRGGNRLSGNFHLYLEDEAWEM